ncbi:hypothetical protein PTKIN_Ptkin11bG0171700 [Pterospermum kingtungense]
MLSDEGRLFEEQLEKKRQGEGCGFEEEPIPKRRKVEDEDEDEDEDDDDNDDYDDYEYLSNHYPIEEDGYEDYSEDEDRFDASVKGQYVLHLPTNDAVDELCKSFYYADILPPHQVRARIQAFLKILTEETEADEAFVRMSKVMKICNDLLIDENQFSRNRVTRKLLFYKLRSDSRDYFPSQLLEPNHAAVDCSARGIYGYAVSSDLKLLESTVMRSDARYIIVVEKEVIFQELVLDRAFNQNIPCILLTASGCPDTATRYLLRRMSFAFPHLPILALVDWKPAGLAALLAYKFGSIGMFLEPYGHGCNVKWLGLRGKDLDLIPGRYFSPLKPRDRQIAQSLISSQILQEKYKEALKLMMEKGRVEFKALYHCGFDSLGKYIENKIEQADYI